MMLFLLQALQLVTASIPHARPNDVHFIEDVAEAHSVILHPRRASNVAADNDRGVQLAEKTLGALSRSGRSRRRCLRWRRSCSRRVEHPRMYVLDPTSAVRLDRHVHQVEDEEAGADGKEKREEEKVVEREHVIVVCDV